MQDTESKMPDWYAVWEYALQEVSIATVLRVALDDPQASVVRAAAEALAALIGPGAEEEHIWQAADDNPSLCKGCRPLPSPRCRRKLFIYSCSLQCAD